MVYKYLSTRNELQLAVEQHEQLDTLDAVVAGAHYAATVIGANTRHSLDLALQHMNQQFLEVSRLPDSAFMFSASIDGTPAKPVRGADQTSMLVPLLGGSRQAGTNDGTSNLLQLSLSYLSTSAPMQDAYWAGNETQGHWVPGNTSFELPQLKLPISVITVALSLPEQFEYNVSSAELGEDVLELQYALPGQALMEAGLGERVREARAAREVTAEGHDHSKDKLNPRVKSRKRKVQQGGIEPGLKVNLPSSGKTYYWERLLVINTPMAINLSYAPPQPPPPPPPPEKVKTTNWWFWK